MTQAPEVSHVRVARDPKGERTDYEKIEIGKDLGSAELLITQEQIDAMCERREFWHPWFSIGSPFGGTVAPMLLSYGTPRLLFSQVYNVRGLFYKWAFENFQPLRPNVPMVVSARLSEKWVKNDREFVAYEATCKDADGRVVFTTRRAHALDYIKRSAPKEGEGLDTGKLPAPAKIIKPAGR
jgi:hypothetical protein